jgi:hypothetical protein
MSVAPISRRTLLKGMGVTMALPWLNAMAPLRGWGAGPTPETKPLRFAALYMANGALMPDWTPKQTGRDFELSPTLAPLADFKKDLLVLTQLWNAATNTGDGHYVKTGGWLTSTN